MRRRFRAAAGDAKLYTYGVEHPIRAIENLTATTLRNLVGELELDGTLTSRDTVNSKMRLILDEATDPWGIKINRVELKNILPPRDIQQAMEKQMRAERERREAIKLINDANPNAAYLTIKGYEALKFVADGKATKIVVPSEIQNVTGLLASLKGVLADEESAQKAKKKEKDTL